MFRKRINIKYVPKDNIAKTYSKYPQTSVVETKKIEAENTNRVQSIKLVKMMSISHVVSKIMNALFLIIAALSGFLGALVYGSSRWVLDTWGNLTVDEIIFHLKVPIEGTNSELIQNFMNACLSGSIIVLIIIIVLMIGVWKKPRYRYFAMAIIIGVSALAITTSIQLIWKALDVNDYIISQEENSTFIQNNYVDPRNTIITFPEKKRNLIYIYMESMENTYGDKENGGAFGENFIPELTDLAKKNVNFSSTTSMGGGATPIGTTWTMGAIFAQTSALPLKIPIDGNSMENQDEFFPDIVTLGDVLNEAGYSQVFMCGSDATFGGRRNYFEQHGKYEIRDYLSAKEEGEIPEDYCEWWGYEDSKLFSFATDTMTNLANSEEPFNLTLLTADTHFEDGYVCSLCKAEYKGNQYANVMACSSRQVSTLVHWIQQQEFYDNTTIILVGDHLTMDSDFCDSIDGGYVRGVYNVIINAPVVPTNEKNRTFTTLDMFPTTLASLGVDIKGNKLGLGVNLFSDEETLAEKVGIQKLNKELNAKSNFFANFTKTIVLNQE